MYKILVLSDSHGDIFRLNEAIQSNTGLNAILFLGDGLRDWDDVIIPPHLQVAQVRGNCDFSYSLTPLNSTEIFEDKTLYMTHGHTERVKEGLEILSDTGKEKYADIVVFGHTHIPYTTYKNGMYFLNPGSVRQNSCGIIEIRSNGILCYTKDIVYTHC